MNQFPFSVVPPYSQNYILQLLTNIEAELKKINAKLENIDKSNFNNNQDSNTYIQKDDNLYML